MELRPTSEMQREFATAYVMTGGDGAKAAIEAGYAAAGARQAAYRLLQLPHVQAAVREAQARTLRGRLASKALAVLEKVLDDENAPPGVRVDAAKTVLDRAGFPASRTPEAPPEDKPLHMMTAAELETAARSVRLKLATLQAEQGDVTDVPALPSVAVSSASSAE